MSTETAIEKSQRRMKVQRELAEGGWAQVSGVNTQGVAYRRTVDGEPEFKDIDGADIDAPDPTEGEQRYRHEQAGIKKVCAMPKFALARLLMEDGLDADVLGYALKGEDAKAQTAFLADYKVAELRAYLETQGVDAGELKQGECIELIRASVG